MKCASGKIPYISGGNINSHCGTHWKGQGTCGKGHSSFDGVKQVVSWCCCTEC